MPIARLAWSMGSFVSVQLRLGTGIPVEEPKSAAHCKRPPASTGHPCRGLTAPSLQGEQGLLPATLRNPQTLAPHLSWGNFFTCFWISPSQHQPWPLLQPKGIQLESPEASNTKEIYLPPFYPFSLPWGKGCYKELF